MMLLRPHTPRIFTAFGMFLAVLFFSIGWLGLPAFRAGYWNDEPIVLGMFVVSACIALWLALALTFRWAAFSLPRGNPLVTIWLLWIGWQVIITLCSQNPWRSWFGPPEQSEGLAWYICASLFMLLLAALWPSARFRKIILGYSFFLMVALALLHLVSDEHNNILAGFFFSFIPEHFFIRWLPFVWPDYLGYMAAWWWIAFVLTYRSLPLRALLPIAALLLVVLLASSNHGAFALMSYGLLITLAIRLIRARGLPYFQHVSPLWRQLVMVAMLLPLLWLFASPYIPTDYSNEASQSIPTRVLLNHISMAALADDPSRLLLGKGWGRFEDDFFAYGLVRDIRVYEDGAHRPNWPLIRGYNYHSHNMASEILLSLGIIGLLLWLLMPLIAARTLPENAFWLAAPMLVAVTILQHLWFAMPQTMPFQAMCWFLLIGNISSQETRAVPRTLMIAATLLCTLALGISAKIQYEGIRYGMLLSDPFGQRYGKAVTAADMQEDIRRGGDRLRSLFINYTKRLSNNQQAVQPKHIALYQTYLESMEAMASDPHTGAYNGAAVLYGYNALISTLHHPQFKELQQRVAQEYFPMAKLHTARTPAREDSIAPFLQALTFLQHDKDHQQLAGVVQELLTLHPSHRSALWVGGQMLATQPGFEAQGMEMMRTALALGADRVYPIIKNPATDSGILPSLRGKAEAIQRAASAAQ